jgi:hypothetical protein
MRSVWGEAMNLLEKVKTMAEGIANLTLWVGSGGVVVDQDEAQARADVCLGCPLNQPGMEVSKEVALATKKFLEFKNGLDLRVKGEKSLHHCKGCGCVLRLLIWEPQPRIKEQMNAAEIQVTPQFCWKLK